MRSAGKCGSIGQVHATGLEHREDSGHPVQVALGHHRDDTLAAQPARQQRPPQPVGAGVELPVGPLPVAVHGRDGVRVRRHPLLEQLVQPAVRQRRGAVRRALRAGRWSSSAESRLCRRVLGIRVGGDQRQGGEVVAGDPGGAVRVEHVGPVPQPQHSRPSCCDEPDPQHACPRRGRRRRRPGRTRSRTTARSGPARASGRRPGSPGAPAAPTRPDASSSSSVAPRVRARSSAGTATAGRPAPAT